MRPTLRHEAVFLLTVVILSCHQVPYAIDESVPYPDIGDASLARLTDGTASRPFQYRVLVPWLVRGAREAGLIQASQAVLLFELFQIAALVGVAYAFRAYLRLFLQPRAATSVMAASIFAILPFNYFNQPYYPYDIPAVLFFTLGWSSSISADGRCFTPCF